MRHKKRKCVSFKDELLHYFLHNEIEGQGKDIASIIYQFVPNPHRMPIQALKQAIKEKVCLSVQILRTATSTTPVDGEARTNNWVIESLKYGRYFRYEMEYYNSYDHNRKSATEMLLGT